MHSSSLRYGKIFAIAAFWLIVCGIVASRVAFFDGIVASVAAKSAGTASASQGTNEPVARP
ncbi:hypothetical protein AB4072_14035 [Microvirga sp. 2MCAF38]|uniref:hypothetical protein n=1 Tax=Microvirga sp. 2MCAF38 TaxID=3232989 RepID=UPI003F964DE6